MPPPSTTTSRGRGRRTASALALLLGTLLLAGRVGAASLRGDGGVGATDKDQLLAAASSMRAPNPAEYGELGNGEIVNLGHNQHIYGLRIHHPTTYEEVAALVRSVRDRGGKLRAVGAAHTWNSFYPDNNTDCIILDKFKGVWQDPKDYTRVTVQAGVLSGELADWADSPQRGYGRFSYLSQDTLTATITFVGGLQTGSHGSGYVGGTLTDSVIALTIVDASGEIRQYDDSHPDFKVMVTCLGMCGIVLDVTVRFDADTSAVAVSISRRKNFRDFFPPPGTPITDSYNPVRDFIEGIGKTGGAFCGVPFNSVYDISDRLDPNRLEEYENHDRLWYIASRPLPGVPVQPQRVGIPGIGGQEEPYYDLDLFYPEDYVSIDQGAMVVDLVYGERRIWRDSARNPYLRAVIPHLATTITNPTFQSRGGRDYNTSRANAQHYAHYVGQGSAKNDYEFAFKVEKDYAVVYEALQAMTEEDKWMIRNRDTHPLNIFYGIRWSESSDGPLSHIYGKPGDKFVLIEPIGQAGTDGWEEYVQRLFRRWSQIRNREDGSRGKPHWAKWDQKWAPEMVPYVREVYAEQIAMARPAILRRDPQGMFRNRFLADMFDLPF